MLKTVSSITNAIGALNYKGTWNANANTPALASGVGTKGDYYVVNVAGSTTLDGISNWGIGDWAVFNGSVWQRVEGGADLNGVNLSVTGTTTLSDLTASTALALDASKNVVSVTNTGTGNNVLATSPRIVTSINDTNGNEIFGITATASAINELTIANAAINNNPSISATGGDTNIGIRFIPKGTGGIVFPAGAAATPAISPTGDSNTGFYFPAADTIGFGTNATERGRVTSAGFFKASNTGGYNDANGTYHELLSNDASDPVLNVVHFGATEPNGIKLDFTAASPDNNTQYFFRCADSTTSRCFIYSDGDLANHDGVYGTISDERLKQDIVDAPSQWGDIKAVRFRKYRMKSDVEANPDSPAMLGVIAQELELTSPGLIDEHPNEEGNTTKTVKSSILLMKAAVALQEAMTRIEALEAKVAALESPSNV